MNVSRTELYFVKPTSGHSYLLECSLNGREWTRCGGHQDIQMRSPHVDKVGESARYLRVSNILGAQGLWEFRVY